MKISKNFHDTIILTGNYTKIILRDKMSIFWFMVFPIILAVLFGYVSPNLGGTEDMVVISEQSQESKKKELLDTFTFARTKESKEEAEQMFNNGYINVLVNISDEMVDIQYLKEQEKLVNVISSMAETKWGLKVSKKESNIIKLIRPIDYIVPGMIALTLLQVGLFGGNKLVDERRKNILRRLKINDVKPISIIVAHIFSRLFIMYAVAVEIIVIGKCILGVPLKFNNIPLVIVAILIAGITCLSLGLSISSIISNSETSTIISQCLNFPMSFLGGVFMPIQVLPKVILPVVKILPITPFVIIIRGLLLENISVADYLMQIAIMIPWLIVTLLIGIVFFKWE